MIVSVDFVFISREHSSIHLSMQVTFFLLLSSVEDSSTHVSIQINFFFLQSLEYKLPELAKEKYIDKLYAFSNYRENEEIVNYDH